MTATNLNKAIIAKLYMNIVKFIAKNPKAHAYDVETSILIGDGDLDVLEDEGIVYANKTLGELVEEMKYYN